MACSALMLAAPSVNAQTKTVDVEGFHKRIAKSDAEVADAKKASKASVWLNRGKLFYDAAAAPTAEVSEMMTVTMAQVMFGEPRAQKAVVNGTEYIELTYPAFVVYADQNGLFQFWYPTLVVKENALETAEEAYDKAVELDPKTLDRVKLGLTDIKNHYLISGGNLFKMGKYNEAAANFEKAYAVSVKPALNQPDTASIYNAGLTRVLGEDFNMAVKDLDIARQMHYYRDGEVYYLLYYGYNGLMEQTKDSSYLRQAKDMLKEGLAKFPSNPKVIEVMANLYVQLGEDPKDIIPILTESIERDPSNPALWNGLARIYEQLGELDASLDAFKKVVELIPDNYGAHFSVGLLYVKKGDKINDELTTNAAVVSEAEYKAMLDQMYGVYRQSIEPLEKAHELAPDNIVIVELLKNVSFRLRDTDESMMAKYEHYNALLKQMKQQ